MINKVVLIFIGFGGGIIVAAGVFALITVLGIVPRLIERSKTYSYVFLYENCIIFGGILGTIISFWPMNFSVGRAVTAMIGFIFGMFVGSLVIALAEFINVLPIMNRRLRLTGGIAIILVVMGLGKTIGSLLYWLVPGLIQVR